MLLIEYDKMLALFEINNC